MKKGIVLGKFMPLHQGHLALIDFACRRCDSLYVIVCCTENEPIPGPVRQQWVEGELAKYPRAASVFFDYDEKDLPNTSQSSREVSAVWARALQKIVPDADIIFTSEPYGEYVAEFMGIRHIMFDEKREYVPVSATQIRSQPLKYWDMIADAAKPYFVKKIVLAGSESTGKSTLAEKLARHFNTSFVPEMARDIIEKTEECTYEDLYKIAALHARAIVKRAPQANRLLFIDTDINITRSYSQFLFGKELIVEPWIEEANRADLYLFLEPDCDYVQDGTRLSELERKKLSDHHKSVFRDAGIPFVPVKGSWDERFQQAVRIIETYFH